jgi:hypothetical protein
MATPNSIAPGPSRQGNAQQADYGTIPSMTGSCFAVVQPALINPGPLPLPRYVQPGAPGQ